jgi:uncharacterized DUF497 family protein
MAVKYFAWDDAKNAKLKADRGIGFEDVVFHIERGDLARRPGTPEPDRYAGQRIEAVDHPTGPEIVAHARSYFNASDRMGAVGES